ELYRYCQNCAEKLAQNARVKDPEIRGRASSFAALSQNEYFIEHDHDKLAHYELTLQDTYGTLKEQLYMSTLAQYYEEGVKQTVEMVSANAKAFDVWNLENEYVNIADKQMRFSDIGKIAKRNSGNEIFRENQQYRLYVVYDYVGTSEQSRRVRNREIKRLNEEVLPIGYKADEDQSMYGGGASGRSQVLLLLIVIAVIYFVCAILFESLLFPLIVIGLIPISIIGVFLTFALTGYTFDQGGFASLVMLAGIVVNAGIYLLNEYREQQQHSSSVAQQYSSNATAQQLGSSATQQLAARNTRLYIKAFSHKIIPILLTVLSTVLGLIPFLIDGASEVFWFAFAIGTMGGLLFSLIALVFFMPIWVPMKKRS
ncbi:MAG: efflux RND transporter permease subunit, partial [Bacteroidales bacterium]|nr:efflux RND transporter permease subunit [Bacteroidales bacterium]